MQIRNPFVGTDPITCEIINTSGVKNNMSCMSTPLITVEDDTVEMLARWNFRGNTIVKVWTKANGWLEMSEYEERKEHERAKAELEKAREALKRKQRKHEDHTPPANELGNDPS